MKNFKPIQYVILSFDFFSSNRLYTVICKLLHYSYQFSIDQLMKFIHTDQYFNILRGLYPSKEQFRNFVAHKSCLPSVFFKVKLVTLKLKLSKIPDCLYHELRKVRNSVTRKPRLLDSIKSILLNNPPKQFFLLSNGVGCRSYYIAIKNQ